MVPGAGVVRMRFVGIGVSPDIQMYDDLHKLGAGHSR